MCPRCRTSPRASPQTQHFNNRQSSISFNTLVVPGHMGTRIRGEEKPYQSRRRAITNLNGPSFALNTSGFIEIPPKLCPPHRASSFDTTFWGGDHKRLLLVYCSYNFLKLPRLHLRSAKRSSIDNSKNFLAWLFVFHFFFFFFSLPCWIF